MSRMRQLVRQFDLDPGVGLGWALLLGTIAAITSTTLLALSGWFLTGAALAGGAGGAAVAAFNYLMPSAGIRALAVGRTGARYGERVTSHAAALGAMAQLRARLFGQLATADPRSVPEFASGEASARLIHDIAALEAAIVRRSAWPAAIIAAVLAAGMVATAGWLAVLAAAVLVSGGMWLIAAYTTRLTTPIASAVMVALGVVRDRYTELALARPEIITYGLTDHALATMADAVDHLDDQRLRLVRVEAALGALVTILSVTVAVAVLLLSQAGPALTALAVFASFAASEALGDAARSMIRAAPMAESMTRLGALYRGDAAPPDTPAITPTPATITIGTQALPPGARILLHGPSGSGKTTLLESLAGLRAADRARLQLAVDGVAVGDAPIAQLTAQSALAPQSPQLMVGSIADNLRVARPALDDAALWNALDVAGLAARVRAMPDGLDTQLGEAGGTLSGGEQKRLSLARAVLAGRPWLLLDEPTEGLDADTEAALITRLDDWLRRHNTGLIIVSHRTRPRQLTAECITVG